VAEAVRPDDLCPVLRASLTAGCAAEAAAAARKAVRRFPDYHRELLRIAGDSHRALAEPKAEAGNWDIEALRFAVQCYERIQQKEPGSLEIVHALVWLQLKGFKASDNADSVAEPLREALRNGTLPIGMYETLAAIELAKMRYDEARRLLVRALEWRPTIGGYVQKPTASLYVHLALAQYYLSNFREARKALAAAANLPQSPLVSQEFKQALSLLNGTKP
jgi:tetratricopeptide (TPR) repeat protein